MTWNTHLYMSIGIRASHFKLLSEILGLLYLIVCELLMNLKKDIMPVRYPHLLDDQNYGDWKAHMSTFIESLGMEV